MKRSLWLILGIGLVMAFGCKEQKSEEVVGEEYGKAVEGADVQEPAIDDVEVREPAVDITAERNQFVQGVEQRMSELDRRIQELEGVANERAADLRLKLSQERQELNDALMQARQASADNWEQAKQSVGQAIDRVQRAYDEAAAALSDNPDSK